MAARQQMRQEASCQWKTSASLEAAARPFNTKLERVVVQEQRSPVLRKVSDGQRAARGHIQSPCATLQVSRVAGLGGRLFNSPACRMMHRKRNRHLHLERPSSYYAAQQVKNVNVDRKGVRERCSCEQRASDGGAFAAGGGKL